MIVLPGVPREMEHIMLESGLRWIAERIASGGYEIIAEHVFVTAGVPEADLADRLEPLRTQLPPTVELAFLPSASGVRIRVRARGRPDAVRLLLDQAVEPLRAALGSAIVSENNERLVEVLQRECIARGKTVAVAESCTGGMLGMEITSVPGSSAYFLGGLICYADAVKIHFGGVRPETIARYGAVSQQTVEELAAYIRAAYGSRPCCCDFWYRWSRRRYSGKTSGHRVDCSCRWVQGRRTAVSVWERSAHGTCAFLRGCDVDAAGASPYG